MTFTLLSLSGSTRDSTGKSHAQSDECEDNDDAHHNRALERTSIEVLFVRLAELLTAVPYQSCRNQEQDEWATDATRVADHHLGVSLEHDDHDDWNSEDDRPDTFNKSSMIL